MNKQKRCKQCRTLFQQKREWQKFCSAPCREARHQADRKEALALLEKTRREVGLLKGR